MAAIALNTGRPIRWEAGGSLVLNDGTDDITLRNKEKGTLVISGAGYDVLEWDELGIPQTPIEGDKQRPRLELELKFSAGDTRKLEVEVFRRQAVATGDVFYYPTAVLKFPYGRDVATGRSLTLVNAYFYPDTWQLRTGTGFDMVRVAMGANSMSAWTTY